ncbi:serine/threonine protein kinase [Salmonella enterica subsp. arizonae]|nr:serine/threonine protein kinase [Salmonella enterica subsp. arizonae]
MKQSNELILNDLLTKPFTFTKRPEHLPCEMRPLWRCSLILIIFNLASKKSMCSLKKLHVINWILKSERNVTEFEFWNANSNGLKPEVRLDPTLDRALELLVSENLITKEDDRFIISERGNIISESLIKLDIFSLVKNVLQRIKKNISETNINKIFQVK